MMKKNRAQMKGRYISLADPTCSLTIPCNDAYDDSSPTDHRLGTRRRSFDARTCTPIDNSSTTNEQNPKLVNEKLTPPSKGELRATKEVTSNCSSGDVKIDMFNINIATRMALYLFYLSPFVPREGDLSW